MSEVWQMTITAQHLLGNLASELYESPGDCLWELVRNGVCACMPKADWIPGKGEVEIVLAEDHPLAPKGRALIILDRGHGFTEPAIKLYCSIGPSLDDLAQTSKTGHHRGAAQKRIGRFAAFALNSACVEQRDVNSGFYILTRTAATGPVKFVSMIPAEIERNQGRVCPTTINADSTELGPQKGIRGSFTVVVIPNSVFANHHQIREALQWKVPRKAEQMFKLMVGGKQLNPPPLVSKVAILQKDGPIEAYLDRNEGDNHFGESGVWLVDAHTGLRVAFAPRLGWNHLPYPLWHYRLKGDIFAPDLLANQDTSRASLHKGFLKSQVWQRITAFLVSQVCKRAEALLGREDTFGRDAASRSLLEFVEQCHKAFGVPDLPDGPVGDDIFCPPQPRLPGTKELGAGPVTRTPSGKDPTRERKKHVVLPLRIGDRTFLIAKRSLDPRILAAVDPINGQTLYFNERGYDLFPSTSEARREHVSLKILEAVGINLFPDSPDAVRLFVADRKKELARNK